MKLKKRHLFRIIPSGLILLVAIVFLIGNLVSPLKSYKYFPKPHNKNYLTEKELQEDLDYVRYYLTCCYAGYDELVEAGFDVDKLIADVKKDCEKEKVRSGYDSGVFRAKLATRMLEHHCIEDAHFGICGESKLLNSMYFSDIYVRPEKAADGSTKYLVVKNEREPIPEKILKQMGKYVPAEIKPGQYYTGPESMLYEWFDEKEKIYRIGTLTRQNIKNMHAQFDGKNYVLPVVSNNWLETSGLLQGMRETKDTLYISLVNFMFNNGSVMGEQDFQTLCNNARYKSAGKKHIIIDLRSNGGGELYRSAMLFSYLFYNQHEEIPYELISYVTTITDDGEIISVSPTSAKSYFYWNIKGIPDKFKKLKFRKTAKEQETDFTRYKKEIGKLYGRQMTLPFLAELFYPSAKKIKLKIMETSYTELPSPDFNGDIYILTDKYSASCSEYSVALLNAMSKGTDIKVHHLGENTRGAVFYIDPATLILPNSDAWFYLPAGRVYSEAFDHPDFHGEGYGWFPEYWVTHYNLLNTLTNLIDDPELESALQGIEKWQLQ